MLDKLDKFQTVEDGNIMIRMHADEANVVKEYAMPLAKRALSTLSKKYGFEPQGPILVEIFPREHPACPIGSDTALDVAIITAPEARDPALMRKLDAVAGRVLAKA